jgi:G:T-mismatch repair DNA endonuclease (very short patch repair protein)
MEALLEKDIQYLKKKKPFLRRQENETWSECIARNLKKRNFITRNEALAHYQTKLASRMSELKQKGWRVSTVWVSNNKPNISKYHINGGDYLYWLERAGKN